MANQVFTTKKPKDTRGTLRRILSYLASYRWIIAVILLLSVVSNVLSLLGPSFAGSAINEASAGVGKVNFERVGYYAKRMLLVYVASSLMTVSINILMTFISKRIARKMRRDVFQKLMKLPVGFFDRNQSGDIISRVSYDIDVVSSCIATDVTQIVTSLVSVMGALLMMVVISPVLSLVVLFTIPMSVLYTVYMRRLVQPRYTRRSKSYGALNGFVEEMLSGQKTIQAYAYADSVGTRFDGVNTEAATAYYEAEFYGCTIGPTMNFINNTSLSLIAMFGSLLYMMEAVSLGNISSFVLYSRKFSGPINEIANVVNELFSALSAAERVFHLLDETEETEDIPNAGTLTDVNGQVELNHVSFGYEPGKTILHDLSLSAAPGKLVAIVGPTGAGKTTIINLLMRFYDVDKGEILVDGQEIRSLKRSSLRSAYAMVLQ
ncbi:MAG: ABC transporter ATP-binding protein, partial [Clostridia bacterium]|nr:ABC transporter ATP-binding protein [Clostridia bacterium]